MDAETHAEIVESFLKYDVNGDGVITCSELTAVLQGLDAAFWTNKNIDKLMAAADINGDGCIQYSEFVTWVVGRSASQMVAHELEAVPDARARMDPKTAVAEMDGSSEFHIAEAFFRFDANSDGFITRNELATVLQNLDDSTWDDHKVNMLLQFADVNGDHRIQYNEFCAWVLGQTPARQLADALSGQADIDSPMRLSGASENCEATIRDAFQRFDTDGDGVITMTELARVLRRLDPFTWTNCKVNALLRAADTNNDGSIQYEEFVAWIMRTGTTSRNRDIQLPPLMPKSLGVLPNCEAFGRYSKRPITVSLVKMNGQTLKSLTLPRNELVKTLREVALKALGCECCRLVSGSTYLRPRMTLADAGVTDGAAITAVVNTGILQFAFTAQGGYAALKADGSVVTWGGAHVGGDSSGVADLLREGVDHVFATWFAFAALRTDGSVVCWGNGGHGGACCGVSEQLREGVAQITATREAFAALKVDGSMVAWGNTCSDAVSEHLRKGVVAVFANRLAFAALKESGAVVTWGDAACGGDLGTASKQLAANVVTIFSTTSAFAALKTDGSVVAWGDPSMGGSFGSVADSLTGGVTAVYANQCAFAAVTHAGAVVTWGHPDAGGCSKEVACELVGGVERIFSTHTAFAALKTGGRVVCWGLEGGAVSAAVVAEEIADEVTDISSTGSAFAALKEGGAVVTWGHRGGGGCSAHVAAEISHDVQRLYATEASFAALLPGGSVVAWGAEPYGGDTSAVADQLREGVTHVFTARQAFAALKVDNSVVVWGAGVEPSAVAKLQPFYAPVAAG